MLFTCLNLFLFHQVVRPLGRISVNKYLYLYLYFRSDVAPAVLGFFWPILYCACAQTATFQLLIQILTSPLDLATTDFLKQSSNFVIRRRFQAVTLTDLDLDICSTSVFNVMKDCLLSGLRIAEGLVICSCTFSLVPSCPNSLSGTGP